MFGRLTPVVKNLLIINVAVFLVQYLLKVDLPEILGLHYIFSDYFKPFQFITHIFVHGSPMHLFSNMFALFIFGPLLEQFWGPKRFLIFFMVTGLGAGALYEGINYYEVSKVEQEATEYLANPNPEDFSAFIRDHAADVRDQLSPFIIQYAHEPEKQNNISQSETYVTQLFQRVANRPMVGASGAVFGILIAFGMLFPNTELMLLFFPFPIKAKYLVTFYGLYEIYAGFARTPGDNVAHFAHIGGMIFAFIMIKYWQNQRENFY